MRVWLHFEPLVLVSTWDTTPEHHYPTTPKNQLRGTLMYARTNPQHLANSETCCGDFKNQPGGRGCLENVRQHSWACEKAKAVVHQPALGFEWAIWLPVFLGLAVWGWFKREQEETNHHEASLILRHNSFGKRQPAGSKQTIQGRGSWRTTLARSSRHLGKRRVCWCHRNGFLCLRETSMEPKQSLPQRCSHARGPFPN